MKKLLILCSILITNYSIFSTTIELAYDDWYPYIYTVEDDVVGIDTIIITKTFNSMGYTTKFIKYDWVTCLEKVKSGEVDGVVSLLKTRERLSYLRYSSSPTSRSIAKIWSNKENYKIDDVTKLGKIIGYTYTGYITRLNTNIVYFNTEEDMMIAFKNNDIDIIYEDLLIVSSFRNKYNTVLYEATTPTSIVDNLFVNKIDNIYVGFSKKSKIVNSSLVKEFDKEQQNFKKTKSYRNLLVEYIDYSDMSNYLAMNESYLPMFFVLIFCVMLIFITYKTLKYNHLNVQSLINFVIGLVIVNTVNMFPFEEIVFYLRLVGLIIVSAGSHKYIQKYYNDRFTIALYSISVFVCSVIALYYKDVSYIHFCIFIITLYFIFRIAYDFEYKKHIIALPTATFYLMYTVITGLARLNIVRYTNSFILLFLVAFILQVCDTFYMEYRKSKGTIK